MAATESTRFTVVSSSTYNPVANEVQLSWAPTEEGLKRFGDVPIGRF